MRYSESSEDSQYRSASRNICQILDDDRGPFESGISSQFGYKHELISRHHKLGSPPTAEAMPRRLGVGDRVLNLEELNDIESYVSQ